MILTHPASYSPRGGHNTSPSTPPAELDDLRRLSGMPGRPPTDHARPSSHSSGSESPRTALRRASPDHHHSASGPPRKQARVGYEHYSPTAGRLSPMVPSPETNRPSYSWRQPEALPRIHDDVLRRAWQTEPYVLGNSRSKIRRSLTAFSRRPDARV